MTVTISHTQRTDESTDLDTLGFPDVIRSQVPDRVQGSYTTRFVDAALSADRDRFHLVSGNSIRPKSGDVVVARVKEIINHKRVETPESRKAILFEGALLLLAYGNRYAADQFLAHVPDSLGECHLVAAGGIAGTVTEQHADIDDPTIIEPVGLLADSQGIVNLDRFAPHRNDARTSEAQVGTTRPEVIGVLGTSMNSGKSTLMACLINGLTKAGRTVTAGKITGTGAGNDPMIYLDAGASKVMDFTDFGYPTTFKLDMTAIRSLTVNLVEQLTDVDTDVVVVEIADGIYQEETADLLRDPIFHATVDQVVFAATDALGARSGVQELQEAGLHVGTASGVMTSSPLATREAQAVLAPLNVPVIDTFELTNAEPAASVLIRDAR